MNGLYNRAREAFLNGSISWQRDTIRAVLLGPGYEPRFDADEMLTDLGVSKSERQYSEPLAAKSAFHGIADAADVTFRAVFLKTVSSLVLFQDTGDEKTSRLIAHFDTAAGLPIQMGSSGGDVVISWSNDPVKIFKL